MAGDIFRHVDHLTDIIGERHLLRYEALQETSSYLAGEWQREGYSVEHQVFMAEKKRCENLFVEMRGRTRPEEIVLVGAHYDTVPHCPGADDNASGLAGLMLLAREFVTHRTQRTLRLAAFVNARNPHVQTARMGSMVHARQCRARREKVVAMLNLSSIGYYTQDPPARRPRWPLRRCFPPRGDYVALIGNLASRDLVRQVVATFRRRAAFPAQGGVWPSWWPGVRGGDQVSFWKQGYQAALVTDDAWHRYPHHHTWRDTPDRLDGIAMARVIQGLVHVVDDLVNPAG